MWQLALNQQVLSTALALLLCLSCNRKGLPLYAARRNDAMQRDGVSRLSAYHHFGGLYFACAAAAAAPVAAVLLLMPARLQCAFIWGFSSRAWAAVISSPAMVPLNESAKSIPLTQPNSRHGEPLQDCAGGSAGQDSGGHQVPG